MPYNPLNSNLNLYIPLTFDDAPPEVRGYLNQILNSLRLLQEGLNDYAGASMHDTALWSYLGPSNTIVVGNMGRLYALASETIAAKAIISIENVAGVLKFRNANATGNTRPAMGYCSNPSGIASGARGECIVGPSLCTGLSALTIGTRYFLDTTNGLITSTEPVAAGNIGQALGIALSTTELYLNPSMQWTQH